MDIEGVGRNLYARAKLDVRTRSSCGALDLATELHGEEVLVCSRYAQTEAEIATVRGRKRIVVAKMGPERTHWAVARMVARIELLRLERLTQGAEDELAAYLVAPTEGLRVYVEAGADISALAAHHVVSQTCVAIRLVEMGEERGVVVTPERVYKPRGGLAFLNDDIARRLAHSNPKSLRKVPLVDAPDRVALFRIAS